MSSVPDPAKLKVVELRAELSARGLDTKGNKAALVKRLKDALEKELKTELPDTSIADTSTEDINTSQTEEEPPEKKEETKAEAEPKQDDVKPEVEPKEPKEDSKKEPENSALDKVIEKPPNEAEEPSKPEVVEPKDEEMADVSVIKTEEQPSKQEENGEQQDNVEEPPSKKGRFEQGQENDEECDIKVQDTKGEDSKQVEDQSVGEKRKRSNELQKVHPRTPMKEDEPPIDTSKVQLNWYDSDLHLQIDKNTLLRAKPYHDGIFGYVWAGVRATHGTNIGKVCFEVKVSEELKWEDVIKQPEKGSRDRDRRDSRRDKRDTKSTPEEKKSKDSTENGSEEKGSEEQSRGDATGEEKMDTVESTKSETEVGEAVNEESCKSQETVQEQTKDDDKPKDTDEEGNKDEDKGEKKSEPSDSQNKEDTCSKGEDQMETDEKKENEATQEEIKILPHLIRIGWSISSESLQLGETKYSYGFESSGKFVSDKQFTEYGKSFGVGDVIGTFLAFSEECVNLIYTINGEELPLAVSIPRSELPEGDFSLFPHVLSKNYAFEVNFGDLEEPFCKIPEKLSEYKFINAIEEKVLGPQRPETRSDCEVIMMIGLPASGKTHWVNDYLEKNRDKKYTVIGNSQLLEKMTVDGTPFRNSVKPYWSSSLLDKLTKTSNKLVDVASARRRNFVIDQTNEFYHTQRRKMRQFDGYKRRAVVIVCGEDEQANRKAQYEEQQDTKLSNAYLCQMKANMSLPRLGDWLEEITYVELKEEDAKAMVQKYNKEARDAGYGNWPRREARNNRFNKWQDNRRNEYHGGFRNKYPPPRFDRGPKQDYRSPRWGQNERRSNRDPPREWRPPRGGSSRPQDRSRDRHSRPGNRDNYNRNRNQGGRNWQGSSSGNWNQGGGWNQGNNSPWSQGGSSGSWSGNSGWSSGQGGNKWNYNQGGGYGQQGYGNGNYPGWNNYYGQNWNQNHGSNHSMSGNGH